MQFQIKIKDVGGLKSKLKMRVKLPVIQAVRFFRIPLYLFNKLVYKNFNHSVPSDSESSSPAY